MKKLNKLEPLLGSSHRVKDSPFVIPTRPQTYLQELSEPLPSRSLRPVTLLPGDQTAPHLPTSTPTKMDQRLARIQKSEENAAASVREQFETVGRNTTELRPDQRHMSIWEMSTLPLVAVAQKYFSGIHEALVLQKRGSNQYLSITP